jgi:cobalt transporter subunit CbtB
MNGQLALKSIALPAGVTAARVLPAFAAMLLGGALVFLVGFAPIEAVHNAAHDTRHSIAFPCH